MSAGETIVTVDIDDVLIPSARWLVDRYNQEWGTELELGHWYAVHSPEWGVESEAEAVGRVNLLVQSAEYLDLEPSEEARVAINSLASRARLHALTGRDDMIAEATRRQLQRHFPGAFHDVHFSNMYDPRKVRSKGEMCLAIGASHHIDDHLGHSRSVAEAGLRASLFGGYPWNQTHELPAGVVRCVDWPAVLEYFTNEGVL